MANMLDYIAWRGDLPMSADGFNEADAAVLARFAYVPFESFTSPLPEGWSPVEGFAPAALAPGGLLESDRWKLQDDRLLAAMARSRRFGPLELGLPVCRFDPEEQTQFFAASLRLGPGLTCLIFRGTDNTLVGWKEDMNMSFRCPIPGQEMAADYVRRAAEQVEGRLILSGHSKGGNLAVYAGAFCPEAVRRRIDAVYNFDGPGFFDDILRAEGYRRLFPRIRSYVPQSSVVGMLLGRREEQTVVHSTGTGLTQHDLYTWELLGRGFVTVDGVTEGSRFVDSTIKDWIADMTPQQFEQFADAIYNVLSGTNARTLHEMRVNWLDSAKSIARSLGDMDEKTRTAVLETLRLLAQSAGHELKAFIGLPEHPAAQREGTD